MDARIQRRQRQPVVEVDVGDDRQPAPLDDLDHRLAGLAVVAGDPHHVGAGISHPGDLVDSALDVAGVGLGHRLHRDRRGAADDHVANPDRRGLAPRHEPGDGHHLAGLVSRLGLAWSSGQFVD